MAEFNQHNQFGSTRSDQSPDSRHCARFEAMLTDAVDGSLSPEDRAAFDAHLLGCATCRASFADAQRGLAWLEMLRPHRPEPAADLLDRILAQTSGQASSQASALPVQTGGAAEFGSIQPLGGTPLSPGTSPLVSRSGIHASAVTQDLPGAHILPFRRRFAARLEPLGHTLLQPRLAMTAAMAFFSVAVTLSLTGIHVTQIRPSDLRPSSLRRGFYEANAHVVRYYDNLRVVYELESRVHDLQRSAEVDSPESPAAAPAGSPGLSEPQDQPASPANTPGSTPDKPARPRPRPGTSLREPLIPDRRLLAVFESPGQGSADPGRSEPRLTGAERSDSALLATLSSIRPRPTQERDLS